MTRAAMQADTLAEGLTAFLLVDCKADLGEAVQWHGRLRRVFWTDITGQTLWSCDQTGARVRSVALEAALCSFAFCDDGRILGAFADGLGWLDPKTGKRRLFEPYSPDNRNLRMNDGALDRQGRFVVGGMDEAARAPVSPVWSIDRGRVRTVIDGVSVANSIAFSPEGDVMYFADTPRRAIMAYDYNPATGTPSHPRVFAQMRPQDGGPDGSAVDAEGGLWNAQFGGGAVQRYLRDGQLDLRVRVPVPNVTSCAIGGIALRRMFITTARTGMEQGALAACPEAGGLYAVDLPVRGLAPGTYKR